MIVDREPGTDAVFLFLSPRSVCLGGNLLSGTEELFPENDETLPSERSA